MAKKVLDVDKELKPQISCRSLTVEGSILEMQVFKESHEIRHYACESIRVLRLCTSSFLESVALVYQTMEAFGPESLESAI